jgi:hypothetical protein
MEADGQGCKQARYSLDVDDLIKTMFIDESTCSDTFGGRPPPTLHFPPKLGRVNIVFARMRRVIFFLRISM